MKQPFLLLALSCIALFSGGNATAQKNDTIPVRFDDYFIPKTLRIDYFLAGDKTEESVFFSCMKQEPFWGGPKKNLIDPFNYGTYRYQAYDSVSGKLIFSRGFSNLYQEWQGTEEAKQLKRAFEQAAVMPFPKKTIRFTVERRAFDDGTFKPLFEKWINPNDYFIIRENPHPIPFLKFRDSGDPVVKVDIAFIAEGYTEAEMSKFLQDARRMTDYMFTVSPYAENRDKFNFYAILSPSDGSGVDVPGDHVYVNTSVNSTFYTFKMDRYMTSFDTRSIYDIAANVPYDAIIVLVNSKIYGGGGFYNHYCGVTVDNLYSKIVFIHELGHSFAGLADEYTGDVSYAGTYNLKVEPWEPNITTNVDFGSKWKNMVANDTPMPTPRNEHYENTIGLFEGGGYVTKGIYSPYQDCRMKSNEAKGFCPVCQKAIRKMIQFYCE